MGTNVKPTLALFSVHEKPLVFVSSFLYPILTCSFGCLITSLWVGKEGVSLLPSEGLHRSIVFLCLIKNVTVKPQLSLFQGIHCIHAEFSSSSSSSLRDLLFQ